jgi:hypothetical protein
MQRLRYQEEAETRLSYLKQVVFYVVIFLLFHVLIVLPPLGSVDFTILAGLYGLVSYFVLAQLGVNAHLSFGNWGSEPARFTHLYFLVILLFIFSIVASIYTINLVQWGTTVCIFSSSFLIGVHIGRAETLEKELASEESRSEAYSSKIIDAIIQRDLSKARKLTNEEIERGRQLIKEYNRESILRSDGLALLSFLVGFPTMIPVLGLFGALGTAGGLSYVVNKLYLTYSEVNRLENREIEMDIRKWRKKQVREKLKQEQAERRTQNKKDETE